MTDERLLDVRYTSIDKVWKASGGDVWLLLDAATADSLDEFACAVDEANRAAQEGNSYAAPFGEAVSTAPKGLVVLLTDAGDEVVRDDWVGKFAYHLRQRGFSGQLRGAPKPAQRAWMGSAAGPEPAAFLSWTIDLAAMTSDPYRTSHWHVPADVTSRLTHLLDRWARLPDSELILRQNIYHVSVHLDDAGPLMAQAVSLTGMAGVDFFVDRERLATHVSLCPGGEGLAQIIGGAMGWPAKVHRLREALIALPSHTTQGFIRPTLRGALDISDVGSVVPLPGIRESHVRYNKHLLDRYLPDAHGIQIVRTAHLERTRDLSSWKTTQLGDDRYLVEATELAPWYAHTVPDPDVLAQARADFAGVLLTEEIIAANPPPW
ncbi:MAG: hypothetical protein DLM58_12370 [Pseudonocardiales bacterium]|nr:MAG: hypothetical protein DLM58_12370 [Pseudonocardiales bacterium]